jgi:hypothetical protein
LRLRPKAALRWHGEADSKLTGTPPYLAIRLSMCRQDVVALNSSRDDYSLAIIGK